MKCWRLRSKMPVQPTPARPRKPRRRRSGPRNRPRKEFKQANYFFQIKQGLEFTLATAVKPATGVARTLYASCLQSLQQINPLEVLMSKHDDADLILKLYDLRREATMRE